MRLVDVYSDDRSFAVLYRLLEEREPDMNVHHTRMPTWAEHTAYVSSRPYIGWYLLEVDGSIVGSVYLTKGCEIGVFIFKEFQGRGYGPEAVRMLMREHPQKCFVANINPRNGRSIGMFEGMGFRHIQNTYVVTP